MTIRTRAISRCSPRIPRCTTSTRRRRRRSRASCSTRCATYYERDNANPHRGAYALSARATDRYHDARERVARFLGVVGRRLPRSSRAARPSRSTSWRRRGGTPTCARATRSSSPRSSITRTSSPGSSWRSRAARSSVVCPLTSDHRVDLDALRTLVGPRTKVVAFNHVSNALGTVNPVDRDRGDRAAVSARSSCATARRARRICASASTRSTWTSTRSAATRCAGRWGSAACSAAGAILEAMPPYQFGGDMIEFVRDEESTWNVLPHKFEAGTPNVADAVGLAAACDYLDGVGMDAVLRARARAGAAGDGAAPRDRRRVHLRPAAVGAQRRRELHGRPASTRTIWRRCSTRTACASARASTARSR